MRKHNKLTVAFVALILILSLMMVACIQKRPDPADARTDLEIYKDVIAASVCKTGYVLKSEMYLMSDTTMINRLGYYNETVVVDGKTATINVVKYNIPHAGEVSEPIYETTTISPYSGEIIACDFSVENIAEGYSIIRVYDKLEISGVGTNIDKIMRRQVLGASNLTLSVTIDITKNIIESYKIRYEKSSIFVVEEYVVSSPEL